MIAAAIRTNVRPWTPTVYAEPPFRTGLPSPAQEQFCFFRPHPARDCPAPCKKNKKIRPRPPRTHRARPALGRKTNLFSARPLTPTGPAPPRAGTNTFFGPGPLRPVQKQKNLQGKLFFRQPRKGSKFSGGQEKLFFSARAGKKKQIAFLFSLSVRTTRKNKFVCQFFSC